MGFSKIRIVCVNQDDYLGRGDWYVKKLKAGIERHANVPYEFEVITQTGEPGWWSKLTMFKPGAFEKGERIVYFDLDTWIVGNIDKLLTYRGPLAGLRDFYRPDQLGSGVLAWEAGQYDKIWTKWESIGKPKLSEGDQMWINMMVPEATRLQDVFPKRIVSYKTHCLKAVPVEAAVVCFHGKPRPHEIEGNQ